MRTHSPCIAICDTLYQDTCTGCGRRFAEVYTWNQMSPQDKELVWQRIEAEGVALRYTTYSERSKISE